MSGLPLRKSSADLIQQPLDLRPLDEVGGELIAAPLFKVIHREHDGDHWWAVVHCACNLNQTDDPLVTHIAQRVRDAYGEAEVTTEAALELSEPEESVGDEFNLADVLRGFRRGLPNPEVEAGKIEHMTNYRSEASELVALGALTEAYAIRFPVAPQRGKTNANQPILGFDNWGLITEADGHYILVLVQVKGTEDKRHPPDVVVTLVEECARIKDQQDEICRALSVLLLTLKEPADRRAVKLMLQLLGKDEMPKLIVAPAVVRGLERSHLDDLTPLRTEAPKFAPAVAYGVTVSLEEDLLNFGRAVMIRARSDD
jgi:hypothetical protein